MTKDLQDKAISIQGKQYVLVSDRIIFFNNNFPNGSIKTELVSAPEATQIIVKATIAPDSDKPERVFTGYSQAVVGQGMVNKTAALENAETSAVGRALAMMGIGVIDSVASADEMHKAGVSRPAQLMNQGMAKPASAPSQSSSTSRPDKVEGGICQECGGTFVKSATSGNVYCKNRCWLPENRQLQEQYQWQKGVESDEIKVDEVPFV